MVFEVDPKALSERLQAESRVAVVFFSIKVSNGLSVESNQVTAASCEAGEEASRIVAAPECRLEQPGARKRGDTTSDE